MKRKLRRLKFRECGLFEPTKEKVMLTVAFGLILLAFSYFQRQAVLLNGQTQVLTLLAILGNTLLLISTVLGFYSLICLVMYFFKK